MSFYAIMMFYFVFTRHEAENVVLPGCNDEGWLSLREFGNDSVTCRHGKFQVVTWTISPPDNNAPIFSGSCPTLGVPCSTYNDIILSRKDESSDLIIVTNYRKYGNTILTCAAESFYSCQIRIGAFGLMPSILFAYSQHGHPYYRGICAFFYPRPADGEIYLSLTVDPGLQDTHIATITIPSHQVPDATLPTLPVTVDGTETMSLMCVISPETTRPYTWSGVQCNEGNGKETCTFTPGSIHTENVVTCLGNFSQSNYNGLTLEARFDFNNANPPDQPVITGYTTGQVLELGHRLEMVCTVHGGSPKVSRIDFTCTGLDDGEDTSNETSVSSSVIIPSISETDNQRLKTYDHPRRRKEEDTHPYTGLRPPRADGARASGTANPHGVYEEIEAEQKPQFSTENGSRLQTSNRQGNESQNGTAVPHVYENTL
ncbi:hypothetical protein BaRGS_00036286 [Batillaria attramentaria]|uniref:Ig-like domain-containing protein n=1 Tax=Batillaria attramentaria TaxID=370345 RepID=A0ABD0JC16_9CAEN